MSSTRRVQRATLQVGGGEGLGVCSQLWWRQLVGPSCEHGENSTVNTWLGTCLSLDLPIPEVTQGSWVPDSALSSARTAGAQTGARAVAAAQTLLMPGAVGTLASQPASTPPAAGLALGLL